MIGFMKNLSLINQPRADYEQRTLGENPAI